MALLLAIALSWTALYVLVYLSEQRGDSRLASFLDAHDISIHAGTASVTTSFFNPLLEGLGKRHRHLLSPWFLLGVIFGFLAMFASVLVLISRVLPSSVTALLPDAKIQLLPHPQRWTTTAANAINAPKRDTHLPVIAPFTDARRPSSSQMSPGTPLPASVDGDSQYALQLSASSKAKRVDEIDRAVSQRGALLVPLVPGVTIPSFHAVYLAVAVFLSASVHELGHALAAASYEARISGVGIFLAFIFPGAYVVLNGVENLSPIRQLKVYCAGAWHNITTALLAIMLLTYLPHLLLPAYVTGAGALVVSLPRMSILQGHVERGDIIVGFGPFPVVDGGDSFRNAVTNLTHSDYSTGFCLSGALFRAHAQLDDLSCCDHTSVSTVGSNMQCFRVPGIAHHRACIPADIVAVRPTCRHSVDCDGFQFPTGQSDDYVDDSKSTAHSSSQNLHGFVTYPRKEDHLRQPGVVLSPSHRNRERCFVAVLPNGHRQVDIRVKSVKTGRTNRLIYEGLPELLMSALSVSSYIPRAWAILPARVVQLLVAADFPTHLERFLRYFVSISFALALVNMAPVFLLDGEYSTTLFLKFAAPNMSNSTFQRFRRFLLRFSSGLLVVNVALGFLQYDAFGLRAVRRSVEHFVKGIMPWSGG